MYRSSLVRMLVLPLFQLALGAAVGCGAIDNAGDDSSSAVTAVPPKVTTPVFIKKVRLQDYDGDGKADPIVYRPKENTWYAHRSSGGADMYATWGYPSDRLMPGDYDGDGKTDFAVWRPSEGSWYVLASSGIAFDPVIWGEPTDQPVPGDFDGDGKQDFAVYRPREGNWYIWQSKTWSPIVKQWGGAADHPVPGDYDGDGKTDVAYFRPSEGKWHILNSRKGTETVADWGDANDTVVPADYDGDGKTDIAIFRPAEGNWYIIPSTTGTGYAFNWGIASDRVVPGDYDGDGKADYAYFRPGDGTWHVQPMRGTTAVTTQFGNATDFVPYHMFTANCGGFNQLDKLMSPYHCSLADFNMMVAAGWPADSRRRGVIYRALAQITRLPSVNQPEFDDHAGLGTCDATAEKQYDGETGGWCSEFVRYVYRNGGVPDVRANCDFTGCLYLHEVTEVSEFVDLFDERGGYFTPASIQEPQPGDYIAGLDGDGNHFGHSQMVIGVWDDNTNLEIIGGNQKFKINGTTHHCVTMKRQPFYSGTTLLKGVDAFGNLLSFF